MRAKVKIKQHLSPKRWRTQCNSCPWSYDYWLWLTAVQAGVRHVELNHRIPACRAGSVF